MKVKIKKLNNDAIIPKYSMPGDAGMDLVAISKRYVDDLYIEYCTGLAIEIPIGYVGLIFPRSSISNTDLTLSNSVGVIDSGYRGEIKFRFKVSAELATYVEDKLGAERRDAVYYDVGDRIGQLIILPYPKIELEEVQELSETKRNNGGYGSTN